MQFTVAAYPQVVYMQESLPLCDFLVKHTHSKEVKSYDGHDTVRSWLRPQLRTIKSGSLCRAPLFPQTWSQGSHLYPSHSRLSLHPPARMQLRILRCKDLIFSILHRMPSSEIFLKLNQEETRYSGD